MIYTIDDIKNRVVPIAKKYDIPEMYLFGSYARNEATEDSDIDFAINSVSIKGLLELCAFREDISEAMERPVDILTLGAMEMEKDNPLKQEFLNNFKKERILLYE